MLGNVLALQQPYAFIHCDLTLITECCINCGQQLGRNEKREKRTPSSSACAPLPSGAHVNTSSVMYVDNAIPKTITQEIFEETE